MHLGQDLTTINNILREIPIPQGNITEDRPWWKLGKFKIYSIKFAYRSIIPTTNDNFPTHKIWIKVLTPKVAQFLWLAFWKTILTIDNLRKKRLDNTKQMHLVPSRGRDGGPLASKLPLCKGSLGRFSRVAPELDQTINSSYDV